MRLALKERKISLKIVFEANSTHLTTCVGSRRIALIT